MSKIKNHKSNFFTILLILLFVTMLVGFVVFRTEGLTTGFKQFYVGCGDETIISNRENFSIAIDKDYRFDIHNEKDTITKSESGYVVKIVPNITSATVFSFIVDGEEHHFGEIESLTDQFYIEIHDGYFILLANEDLTDMIKDKFKTENATGCPVAIDSGIPYFRLVITNSDSGETININFNIKSEVI